MVLLFCFITVEKYVNSRQQSTTSARRAVGGVDRYFKNMPVNFEKSHERNRSKIQSLLTH